MTRCLQALSHSLQKEYLYVHQVSAHFHLLIVFGNWSFALHDAWGHASTHDNVVVKACHHLQAPPSLDENNFPSLATSPGPSPRAAANGPASADGPTLEATAVAESDDTESPKAAEKPRAVQKVPSVWGSVESSAHKATSPEKKSSGAGWISKVDSMSSQQKAQAANSKLQPSAASFKSRNKSTSKVPWVETGLSFCFGIVFAMTISWPDKLLMCALLGNKHPGCSRKACRESVQN